VAFGRDIAQRDSHAARCKDCHHFRRIAATYGLLPETYRALVRRQNGVCAICKEAETRIVNGSTARLSVDHNHATKKVRGLVCDACNKLLGQACDDPRRLRAAADYLENNPTDSLLAS
jgi:hypothetical protein